jgi:hypothetical protein
VEDFSLLEANHEEFVRRCDRATSGRVPLTPAVAAIFHQAREQGNSVYVIEMPMTERHRQRYYSSPEWIAYRAQLMELLREAGGSYVAAADWVEESGFADHFHLNPTGANKFSKRLGQWLQNQR